MRPYLVGVIEQPICLNVYVVFAASAKRAKQTYNERGVVFGGERVFVIPLPKGARYTMKERRPLSSNAVFAKKFRQQQRRKDTTPTWGTFTRDAVRGHRKRRRA